MYTMEVLAVQNQYPATVHYTSDWKSQLTLSTPTTAGLLKSQPEYIFKATSITKQVNNKNSNNNNHNSSSNSNSNNNNNKNNNNNNTNNCNRHIPEYQQQYKLKHPQQKQLQQQQYQCQNQHQSLHTTKHLQSNKRNHNIFYFNKKPNVKQLQQQQLQLQTKINYATKGTTILTTTTTTTTNTSNSLNKLNCDTIKPAVIVTEAAASPAAATATATAVADKAEAIPTTTPTTTPTPTPTRTLLLKRTKSPAVVEKRALKRNENKNENENENQNENENVLNTTAVQELSQRLLEELRIAKSRHLTCTEVHIPCDLTSRIALQILKLAHEERNGLRDCIIYIEFEDEPNNSRRIATLDLLNKYRQRSQRPIYEIYVTLRQYYPSWTALLPFQFIKHLSRSITISPQFNITKHKPYYSAKSNLR